VITVYVPKEGVEVPGLDARQQGAALVAVPAHDRLNLFICERALQRGHRNTLADRVREAATSLSSRGRAPGVRSEQVDADDYLEVARWDDSEGIVRLLPGRELLLRRWTGGLLYRNDLEASDSRTNVRQEARQDMRRAHLQGRPDKAAQIAADHNLRGW